MRQGGTTKKSSEQRSSDESGGRKSLVAWIKDLREYLYVAGIVFAIGGWAVGWAASYFATSDQFKRIADRLDTIHCVLDARLRNTDASIEENALRGNLEILEVKYKSGSMNEKDHEYSRQILQDRLDRTDQDIKNILDEIREQKCTGLYGTAVE
jgi:hypothetical protein